MVILIMRTNNVYKFSVLCLDFHGFSSPDSARDACIIALPEKLAKYQANAYEVVAGQSHDSRQECDSTPFSYSMQVIGYKIM